MNLQSDDFALFGLAPTFAQDAALIDTRWKELQRQHHPDKFAHQDAALQRTAMQWSVRINEAYQRLKDPLKRAAYLCERAGSPIQAHSNTAMPAEFLMQQMQWRESLEDAAKIEDLESLLTQVRAAQSTLLAQCAQQIDGRQNYAEAVKCVRALLFLDKFSQDLDRHFEQFE